MSTRCDVLCRLKSPSAPIISNRPRCEHSHLSFLLLLVYIVLHSLVMVSSTCEVLELSIFIYYSNSNSYSTYILTLLTVLLLLNRDLYRFFFNLSCAAFYDSLEFSVLKVSTQERSKSFALSTRISKK